MRMCPRSRYDSGRELPLAIDIASTKLPSLSKYLRMHFVKLKLKFFPHDTIRIVDGHVQFIHVSLGIDVLRYTKSAKIIILFNTLW